MRRQCNGLADTLGTQVSFLTETRIPCSSLVPAQPRAQWVDQDEEALVEEWLRL